MNGNPHCRFSGDYIVRNFNSDNQLHGEYKEVWYESRSKQYHCMYVHGVMCGEFKSWNSTDEDGGTEKGKLVEHLYIINGDTVHDFIKEPLDDDEKLLLMIQHGGKFLPEWSWND